MSINLTQWEEDYESVIQFSPFTKNELYLFNSLENDEIDDRNGLVGCIGIDLEAKGADLHTTWFNAKTTLKTRHFNDVRNEIIGFMRGWIKHFAAAGRWDYRAICLQPCAQCVPDKGAGFKIQRSSYMFYILCNPTKGGCEFFVSAYDNEFLKYELAGQHDLPLTCFSVEPITGTLIWIVKGQAGYIPCSVNVNSQKGNRRIADAENARRHITRAQEAAMLNGSTYGWNNDAAKPWNYYPKSGSPRWAMENLILLV